MKTYRVLAGLFSAMVMLYLAGGFDRAQAAPGDSFYSTDVCGGYVSLDAVGDPSSLLYVIGDLNGDGRVNVVDVLTFAETWGKSTGDPGFNPEADFNCDGAINAADLLTLAGNFGT